MFLLLISFLGGLLTVLAPCILPLLPVIIGGSLSEGGAEKFNGKKAFTIILSLGASVIAFTFLLKASTLLIDIPASAWTWISGGIVLLLGIVTLFPSLWEGKILAKLSASSNRLMGTGYQKKSFWGDVIIGAALGPVFSTCSPTYFIVLATVLPVNPILGVTYLLAYTFGLCLALLIVSFVGQKIMNKLGVAADPKGWFKRTLGILFIIVGLAVITGADKQVQLYLLSNGFFDVTTIEQKLLQSNQPSSVLVPEASNSSGREPLNPVAGSLDTTKPGSAAPNSGTNKSEKFLTLAEKAARYPKAPELVSPSGFVNTGGKPITLASLKGKVVLLDIWTYSCINCQRTLPYIKDWYAKYKDQGLEIVGLHTPEFAFEHIQSNVEDAVKKFGLTYPVVLDNDYATWRALGNQFWPRKYLIDMDGYIVYDHAGEGAYDVTEKAIQAALRERAARLGMKETIPESISAPAATITVEAGKVKSFETYFGSARNEYLANGKQGRSGVQEFIFPSAMAENLLYLEGTWNITPEYAENAGAAGVRFDYEAKNVYMAAGSAQGAEIEIYQDEKLVKKITVKDEQLYTLIEGADYGKHALRIKVLKAGLKAFTFTFG